MDDQSRPYLASVFACQRARPQGAVPVRGFRISHAIWLTRLQAALAGALLCVAFGCGANEQETRAELKKLGAFLTPDSDDKPVSNVNLSLVSGTDEEKKQKIDAAVKLLPSLSAVKTLDARGAPVSDEHMQVIGKLDSLIALTLTETQVTDEGMQHLTGLSELVNLTLYGTAITEKSLQHIGKLKTVKILNIGETQVAGDFSGLAGMESLEWLVGSKLKISDEAAETLSNLKNLSHLQIPDAEISPDAAEKIRQKRPGIMLEL